MPTTFNRTRILYGQCNPAVTSAAGVLTWKNALADNRNLNASNQQRVNNELYVTALLSHMNSSAVQCCHPQPQQASHHVLAPQHLLVYIAWTHQQLVRAVIGSRIRHAGVQLQQDIGHVDIAKPLPNSRATTQPTSQKKSTYMIKWHRVNEGKSTSPKLGVVIDVVDEILHRRCLDLLQPLSRFAQRVHLI